jgi:PncC family amidohydrolase
MGSIDRLVEFLDRNGLCLVTAESCTAGLMASLMADVPGCAAALYGGFVVYAEAAKQRCLGVSGQVIQRYGLTSEQVAEAMALGALRASGANLAIANTGLAGPPDPSQTPAAAADGAGEGDGAVPEGTVCFACAMLIAAQPLTVCETRRFAGDRNAVRLAAARFGLARIPHHVRTLRRR